MADDSLTHAVVVGGGIAGLLAAQALSPWFHQVTVVERDRYPEGAEPRKGIPQGRCLHMLMAGGLLAFEQLVPTWRDELTRAGAVGFDFAEQGALVMPQGRLPRFRCGLTMYACSRGLLEWVLRCCVLRNSNVRLLQQTPVEGLLVSSGAPDGGLRVTGVHVREKDAAAPSPLAADVVVVAEGRGALLPSWLQAAGCPAPESTVIDSPFHYTSRWYAIPADFRGGWKLLSISPSPPSAPWGSLLFEIEGQRWGVVLLGPKDESAPLTNAEFLHCAARLRDPTLYEAIERAQPLSGIHRYGHSKSRIYHYERSALWPERLVALGDTVCVLDPYFGLGMTASALGAVALAAQLAQGASGITDAGGARLFQQRLARSNARIWELISYGPASTIGEPISQKDAYFLACLSQLAPSSPALSQVLMERIHAVAAPDALTSPHVKELVRSELLRMKG